MTLGGSREPRTVRLSEVPAALFIRLQVHVDDLLRELEIIDLGHDSSAVVVPSEVRKVTRDLLDSCASSRSEAWQRAEAAERAGRERLDIELRLPPAAADAGEKLGELLELADELSRSGLLLTMPCPEELLALRRWMSEELSRQLRDGAEPTPYAE